MPVGVWREIYRRSQEPGAVAKCRVLLMSSVVSEAEMAGAFEEAQETGTWYLLLCPPSLHCPSQRCTEACTAGSPYPRGPELRDYLGFCLLWLSDGVCPTWLSVVVVVITTVTRSNLGSKGFIWLTDHSASMREAKT